MEKVERAPINHVNYESNVQEITKEELDEAGIVIDYIDENLKKTKEQQNDNQKKRNWKFKNHKRWILLTILMFFVAIIIKMGTTHIAQEETTTNKNETPNIVQVINKEVNGI